MGFSAEQDAHTRLASEIAEVIEPYVASFSKPPFSNSELIAMAAATLDVPFKREHIFEWIVRTFSYYKEAALDRWLLGKGRQGCDTDVIPGFVADFRTYGLPLMKVAVHGLDPHDMVQQEFKTTPAEARIYLRNLLSPREDDSFDFLRLPAELRVEIYEYVLTYSGLYKPYPKHDTGNRGYASQLVPLTSAYEPDVFPLYRGYDRPCIGCLHVNNLPLVQEVLALLTVSKEVYAEAMPVFYKVNHFYVQRICGLNHFACNLNVNRLRYVAQITFD